ncbi:MAG: heparinase II/III family protein [Planctomycetia bacterium]|nr:heparinase II/III family protein [Planctomycetia bacterium]
MKSGLFYMLMTCALVLCPFTVSAESQEERNIRAAEIENRAKEILPMMVENFQLVPPVTDRAFWDDFAETDTGRNAVREAEASCQKPIPELKDAWYLEYSQDGNRTHYEEAIGRRNGAFRYLVYAECAENQGRFMPRIEEYIRVFAADRSWVSPAHDPGLKTFNGKHEIDLASSAFCWQLALAGQILETKMSSETREILDKQLRIRCFEPFENSVLRNDPYLWWITSENNWNAVCLAGVTGAALANLKSPEKRAWYLAAAEKFIRYSTDGYSNDGYCSEGVSYWCYGFENQIALSELFRRVTANRVRLLDDEKLRKVAWYGFSIEIVPGISPTFADCAVDARPDAYIRAFLNRYYDFHLGFYDSGIGLQNWSFSDFGIFHLARTELPESPAPGRDEPNRMWEERTWFPDAQVLICRPHGLMKGWTNFENNGATRLALKNYDGLAVAMKGGHNDELHNHNDVGSYIVVYRGTRPCLDLGREVYTQRTFSPRRYESDLLNSWGHNVPIVAGQLQKTGRDAAAKNIETEFTDEKDVFQFDLRDAYQVPECERLERKFVYDRTGKTSLMVEDSVEFSSPQTFETAIVTIEPWRVSEKSPSVLIFGSGDTEVRAKIEIFIDGKRMKASKVMKLVESGYESDFRDRSVARRIGIALKKPVKNATVRITYGI